MELSPLDYCLRVIISLSCPHAVRVSRTSTKRYNSKSRVSETPGASRPRPLCSSAVTRLAYLSRGQSQVYIRTSTAYRLCFCYPSYGLCHSYGRLRDLCSQPRPPTEESLQTLRPPAIQLSTMQTTSRDSFKRMAIRSGVESYTGAHTRVTRNGLCSWSASDTT